VGTPLFRLLVAADAMDLEEERRRGKGRAVVPPAPGTSAFAGLAIFRRLRRMELTQQMRASEDADHVRLVVEGMLDVTKLYPVSEEWLRGLKMLRKADVEADPEWAFAQARCALGRRRRGAAQGRGAAGREGEGARGAGAGGGWGIREGPTGQLRRPARRPRRWR
jgi:hypothetical protein